MLETVADQIAGVICAARLLEALQHANAQLQDAFQAMESLSQLDGLTGLANRRRFDEWIAQALERAAASRRSLALLLVDVDHFKAYNDGYGHLAGDGCLKQVASLLAYMLDGTTMRLARYGGEEFVVLLPDADLAAALVQGGAASPGDGKPRLRAPPLQRWAGDDQRGRGRLHPGCRRAGRHPDGASRRRALRCKAIRAELCSCSRGRIRQGNKMRRNDMGGGGAVVKAGISFGSALAMVISWTAHKSLLWVIVHGLLSWLYVIYYALRYHFKLVSF